MAIPGPALLTDTGLCLPLLSVGSVLTWQVTKTQLPRTGISNYSVDTDTWPGRSGFNTEYTNLNNVVAIWAQGTTASRPVAAYSGRFFWATDALRLWYDNGTAWTEVSPIGGGGAPSTIDIGDAAAEGVSRIGARADHQHPLPIPDSDPAASGYGGAVNRGSSATPARANHAHALPALPYATAVPWPNQFGVAGGIGVSNNLARQDHSHQTDAPLFYIAGMFTGIAPSNLGLLRMMGWYQTFGTNVNGDFTVAHTGILNGTIDPQSAAADPATNTVSICPVQAYSSPGSTVFRAYGPNGQPQPFTSIKVSGHIFGW